MNNEQLTQFVQRLQATVQSIQSELTTLIPRMSEQMDASNNLARTLDEKLRTATNRIVEANVLDALKKLDDRHTQLTISITENESRLKDVGDKIKLDLDTKEQDMQNMRAQLGSASTKFDLMTAEVKAVQQQSKEKKRNEI